MSGISITFITGCIAIIAFVVGNIWKTANYTNTLQFQVSANQKAIKDLRKDLKYAYKLLENAHRALEIDVFDVQGYLTKAPLEPRFQIRGRSEISSNSGADFLEERND